MRQLSCLLAVALLAASAAHADPGDLPIRVILVGDSTMATRTGYGDALCARFTPATRCINLARGGRSSGSFRAEGRWDEVTRLLGDGVPYRASYVLVQFGHNDQPGKPGHSTDLVTQFPANMARYASDVKALGGVPVLVTPLTRRTFQGAWLKDDLGPWAQATRQAAAAQQALLIDLNVLSAAAVQPMGQEQADTLAMGTPGVPKSGFDRTHLGNKGAALFAGIVARELARVAPPVAASLQNLP